MNTTENPDGSKKRRYWVVSPNVRNKDRTVSYWRQKSVRDHAAFMGWLPDDFQHGKMGPKFAGKSAQGVSPGDVILIARRHNHNAEIVGFGVVVGQGNTCNLPDGLVSLRKLSPFVPWSHQPERVPLLDALRHTKALVQLHPSSNHPHQKVCDWMEKHLSLESDLALGVSNKSRASKMKRRIELDITVIDPPQSHQLDYKVQTRSRVIRAKKLEASLVHAYSDWLKKQGRTLEVARYANLKCDGYERATNNLVEAKAVTSREHIRMAVGQLLDYAFQGSTKFGEVNKAVLLPGKPSQEMIAWLQPLRISLVWREDAAFLDNANGRFT